MTDPEYISTTEAAKLWNVSPRWVVELINRGVLPAYKLNPRSWAVDRAAIWDLLSHGALTCQVCGLTWHTNYKPGMKRFSPGFWRCPNGCNDPERPQAAAAQEKPEKST